MQDWQSLSVDKQGTIATVTMRGPGKGNAMGPPFWREMPALFRQLDADPEVRAIVLRGAGDHFSYGLDLGAMMPELGPLLSGEQRAGGRGKLLQLIADLQETCSAVANCRKAVVAAIHGWCIGGGLDLAAACDIRLCSTDAKFSLREIKLAMVADLGSLQRLPRIIGEGATRELALTGKNIDASRASRIGLVSEVLDSAEALFSAAHATASEIAANSPIVVEGIKNVLAYGQDKSVDDGLRYVAVWNAGFLQSRDLEEAITAFFERRAPSFRGE